MTHSHNLFLDAAVPGKVLFIDCKAIAPKEFAISWGWPLVHEADMTEDTLKTEDKTNQEVVDKSLLHAVIEYSERGQVKRATAQTSPYIFKGIPY